MAWDKVFRLRSVSVQSSALEKKLSFFQNL